MKRLIATAALALSLVACQQAGPFRPDATLDPTQVETPPASLVIPVTPQECLDALTGLVAYTNAQNAILADDDAAYQALADNNIPALDRAATKRKADIAARDAIDTATIMRNSDDCVASAQQ